MDMPQKSLRVEALDGAFEYPVFIDRTAISYPSLVLRNSGNDCLFTRVADGVQNRLVEKYTDAHLLTLAWQPVHVYLNDEYWGIYNMREGLDARTVCRYEQIPEAEADNVTLLYIAGRAVQGNSQEYKALRKEMKDRDPANNPEDLELWRCTSGTPISETGWCTGCPAGNGNACSRTWTTGCSIRAMNP